MKISPNGNTILSLMSGDWVTRTDMTKLLEVKKGVKEFMAFYATRKSTTASYVAEQRHRGKPNHSSYRIRPAKDGETEGQVVQFEAEEKSDK
jgi:NDP-sugar pyrophosphorylase family protein